jgi:hypothetical protein
MIAVLLRLRVTALVGLVLAGCAASALGQTGSSPRAGDRWEPDRLRRVIEERYRVVPLNDGVALVPRRDNHDVKSIEVRGDLVAINGTPVTGAEARERLGADAGAILALSYLDARSRRALFEAPPNSPGQPAPDTAPAERQPNPPSEAQTPPATVSPEYPATGESRRTHGDVRLHIGGSVHVDENETVDGPAVAIGGSVTVDGEVRDDVVAIGGNVRLGPKARVGGDVTSVGGTIERDPRAEIRGKMNEIALSRFPHIRLGPAFWFPATGFLTFGPWVELIAMLFRMVLFGVLAFLVLLLARNPLAQIERAAAIEPWKAGLVGLLTQLLFIPVFVLTIIILAVSIIGIPLLLFVPPLAILALLAALVIGFTGVACRIGRWAEHRLGWRAQSPFVLLFVGLLGIWAFTIVGRIVSLGGWPIWFVSAALLVVGFLVEYVAWTVGLGAAVMTRFGTRPAAGGGGPAVAVAPPGPAGYQVGGTA